MILLGGGSLVAESNNARADFVPVMLIRLRRRSILWREYQCHEILRLLRMTDQG